MRKVLVVLFCLLVVFAVVSCKNEPKNSKPAEKTIPPITEEEHAAVLAGTACYRLTATRTAKRFALQYTEDGGFTPEQGGKLTLKYRTKAEIGAVDRLYIRDAHS